MGSIVDAGECEEVAVRQEFGPDANFELDDVVSALLSRAQQKVLCHQYDEAIADLNLWPADSRDEMKDKRSR